MNIDDSKKSRAVLKSYFVKNAIPTEQQFAQVMDGMLNQRDDGLVKVAGDPLSIEAAGDDTSFKKALNFYNRLTDNDPAWTLSLRPRSNKADPQTGRAGFSINDAAGNSRLAVDAATGRVGIGTVTPSEQLEVSGRIKAGPLAIGPWPVSPGQYVMFGAATLDQTQQGNYALLQSVGGGDVGTTYLNSPVNVRFRIGNADRMVLMQNGNVGIGTTAPGEPLDVNGRIKAGALAVGPWPANPGQYVFFGATTLDQAQAGNYALLQSAGGGDMGVTYLNSSKSIQLRIGNGDRAMIDPSGMTVFGPFKTQAAHTIKLGFPSPNGKYGNDGIRGEPNLWLDAAGTVFIKAGFQAPGLDIAERFPASEPLTAGDVIVYDESDSRIRRCDRTADRRAVGIVSAEAAFILGIEQTEVPVALCGRVPCKVDADIAPVIAGDLLTTSTTPGHAQKADDPAGCVGAIIGKALTSLASGRGEILVLVHAR
jgi:hypothetical protein